MYNYLRLRYRRQLRRLRRWLRVSRVRSEAYVNRHIWGKWHQLRVVRRFIIFWGVIWAAGFFGLTHQIDVMRASVTQYVPQGGGIYSEAAIGTVKVLNPVLPESMTTNDMNSLIFSGLTRYNARRQPVPDLATSWDISADGKTYTFHLRHGVKWHDGVPFTSADVVFTLTAIQNPDSRSPLASSWQGVKAEAHGDDTVVFTLPDALASFIDETTVGIVPRHLLESIDPSSLRENAFNQHPIGTGPFKLKTFAPSANEVTLVANNDYYFGRPQLDEFDFRLYPDEASTLNAYAQHQVMSVGRITSDVAAPARRLSGLAQYDFSLPEEVTLFFRTDDGLAGDKAVRTALIRCLSRDTIIQTATAGQATAVSQPILPGQPGYTTKYAPAPLSLVEAGQALDDAGWTRDGNGLRRKDGQQLKLSLVTLAGSELEKAANSIKQRWADLGVQVDVTTTSLSNLQQSYIRPRAYQLLLFGMNVGADPDVYPFWHSSQIKDPGVNLSDYSSADADRALEAGRIKTDSLIRMGKYDSFLKAWNSDLPAAVLYQSTYRYGATSRLSGVEARQLVDPSDRFYDVQRWTIRQRAVLR